MSRAGLPMYDLAPLRAATDAWWAGLAVALGAAGVPDVPARLDRDSTSVALWEAPDLLLAQACGYPLVCGRLAGRVLPVVTPCYRADGCDGPAYRSLVLVRADDPVDDVAGLRGAVCAINGWDSQSGMNALRRLVAPHARDGRFFAAVRVAGTHRASLALVRRGEVRVAAVDCVTYALLRRWLPDAVDGTRVLARSAPAPGLPYVTSAARPAAERARIREAVLAACADPDLAEVREALLIGGVAALELGDYEPVRRMAQEAAAAGFPALA